MHNSMNSMNRAWPCLHESWLVIWTPVGWILGFPPLLHRSEQQRRAGDAGGAPELQVNRSSAGHFLSLLRVLHVLYRASFTPHVPHVTHVPCLRGCHIRKHTRCHTPLGARNEETRSYYKQGFLMIHKRRRHRNTWEDVHNTDRKHGLTDYK